MFDLKPVGLVIGWLLAVLGVLMLVPAIVDVALGNDHWLVFVVSAGLTAFVGVCLVFTTRAGVSASESTTVRQAVMLVACVYTVVPAFAAVPFVIGATSSSIVDAVFESMSGFTTTGATVFVGLEELPEGLQLWRGMLQWTGGIAVVVIALSVLPGLRFGGMALFMRDNYEAFSSVIPRAVATARDIFLIYFVLTLCCAISYVASGLSIFDAWVHSMTTIATGGFANYDSSFTELGRATEYVAVVFMLTASLPFFRYVQFISGSFRPLFVDSQVRTFLSIAFVIFGALVIWQRVVLDHSYELAIRKAMFNGVSILTGTGYASTDYGLWGSFPIVLMFLSGLIGGCMGSTCCAIKVFRFQLMVASVKAQIKRLNNPHAIIVTRYQNRNVPEDVMSSVLAYFVVFLATLGGVAILLAVIGLDMLTSLSGAAATLANVGPGLGPVIGPSGNYAGLPDAAKVVLTASMLMGRLELLAVFALVSLRFWRA
ncbi:MAG: TrkH family potassium uptake protein [Rhodobacteraceae bacterium]|nr:TrkH family potassium uptake protein [Paracoccaceae bacterium]